MSRKRYVMFKFSGERIYEYIMIETIPIPRGKLPRAAQARQCTPISFHCHGTSVYHTRSDKGCGFGN